MQKLIEVLKPIPILPVFSKNIASEPSERGLKLRGVEPWDFLIFKYSVSVKPSARSIRSYTTSFYVDL